MPKTKRDNEWIVNTLNSLIDKYGFEDVSYAFGVVTNPTLSAALSKNLASHKNIEHDPEGSPDLDTLKEVVELLGKRNLIVRRPADNFADLAETLNRLLS